MEEIIWYHVSERLPRRGAYVLAARKNSYGGPFLEYVTAKYMEDYKGWTGVGSERITDSGYDVEYWTEWWPAAIGDRRF